MLRVPGNNVARLPGPKVPDQLLLMAAATIHEQGRLVEPAGDMVEAAIEGRDALKPVTRSGPHPTPRPLTKGRV